MHFPYYYLSILKTYTTESRREESSGQLSTLCEDSRDDTIFMPISNEEALQEGIESLAVIFGLDNSELLVERVQMYSIQAGTVISREGDQDPSLYFVVSGSGLSLGRLLLLKVHEYFKVKSY